MWSYLDSITTHPAGPRLQRVDININYSFCSGDDGEEPEENKVMPLKALFDGLPLLHMKGILFVKAASGKRLTCPESHGADDSGRE